MAWKNYDITRNIFYMVWKNSDIVHILCQIWVDGIIWCENEIYFE